MAVSAAVFVLCLVLANAAPAATQIGEAQNTGNSCSSDYTLLQESAGHAPRYVVPAGGGVITSWSMYAGSTSGQQVKFKVFSAAATAGDYRAEAETAVATLAVSQLNTFPARVPVREGWVIGFYAGTALDLCYRTGSGDGADFAGSDPGDLPPGSTATFLTSPAGYRLNIAANLEPDRDGDQYGDETQDSCPNDPTVHSGSCDADIAVTKTAPVSATLGQNITYTITVTNNGPGLATGATMTDALPTGTSFVSASSPSGSCSGTSTVTCAFGDLSKGASATVTIVAAANSTGPLTNTATANSTAPDGSTGNNTSSATTVVAPPGQAPVDPFRGVALSSQVARLRSSGKVPVRVGCPTGTPGRCVGTLVLKTSTKVAVKAAAKKKILKLGRSSFSIQAGKTAKVFVKLSRAGKRLLLKRGKLGATGIVVAKDGLGTKKTTRASITLKAKKRRR